MFAFVECGSLSICLTHRLPVPVPVAVVLSLYLFICSLLMRHFHININPFAADVYRHRFAYRYIIGGRRMATKSARRRAAAAQKKEAEADAEADADANVAPLQMPEPAADVSVTVVAGDGTAKSQNGIGLAASFHSAFALCQPTDEDSLLIVEAGNRAFRQSLLVPQRTETHEIIAGSERSFTRRQLFRLYRSWLITLQW